MIVLYSVIMLFIFYLLGCTTIKLFKLQSCKFVKDNVLIPIVIGFVVNVSLLETLGMILPVSIVTIVNIALTVFGAIWCYKDIKLSMCNLKGIEKFVIASILIPTMIIGLPQIVNNELFIVIGDNPDFAYYVASIEWLKSHSILETVGYSHAYPFYSMAEFMLHSTRIGTDLTGAFVANLFVLEAHEAFSILAVLSSVVLMASVYSIILYFTQNSFCGVLFGVYVAVCGNTIALVAAQYVPQIFGVGCLVLAFASVFELLNKGTYRNAILCGLFVSGVFATYCEYTVYIVIVALVLLLYAISQRKVPVLQILFAIFSAIAFNCYGFYKAVCFNLTILSGILEGGASTIDPYGGQMLGKRKLFGNLIGLSSKEFLMSIDSVYLVCALLGIIGMIVSLIIPIIKKSKNISVFVLINFIVVFGLELYFRSSNGGYQEYKHITTSCTIILCVIGISFGLLWEKIQMNFLSSACLCGMLLVALYSVWSPLKYYVNPALSINSETAQLSEAAKLVPANEEIRIDSEIHWLDYMGAVYALKEHAINLDGNEVFEQNNWAVSYLHFFQTFDTDESRYTIYSRGSEIQALDEYSKVIWCNDKYALVENEQVPLSNRMQITTRGWGYSEDVRVFRESDCIINTDGKEGSVLYGPYIKIDHGTYDIELEYTVLSADNDIGYFEVCSSDGVIAEEKLQADTCSIRLRDVSFSDENSVEFRVYANEGTIIKVEGISLLRD